MLIATSKLSNDVLKNEVAIVTGSGRGIGYEAARNLIWLGAKVIVAEIDEDTGKRAAEETVERTGEVIGKGVGKGVDITKGFGKGLKKGFKKEE